MSWANLYLRISFYKKLLVGDRSDGFDREESARIPLRHGRFCRRVRRRVHACTFVVAAYKNRTVEGNSQGTMRA